MTFLKSSDSLTHPVPVVASLLKQYARGVKLRDVQ